MQQAPEDSSGDLETKNYTNSVCDSFSSFQKFKKIFQMRSTN